MKRILLFLCCAAVLMSCVSLPVLAATPDEGTINSAALSYFTGVVNKLPSNCNYVIYRSGDYSATLVYGYDLVLSDSSFICDTACTRLIYNSRGSGSGYDYIPTITESTIGNFNLTTSDTSILYSSLGSFAGVGDTSKDTITYILWSVVILIFLYIVFKFHRNRRHYINL